MFNLPTQYKHIFPPLLLICIMVILELLKPVTVEWLGFYQESVFNGEVWRLITGQLLHTNFNHLLLNSLGVLLIWALHGEYFQLKNYFLLVFISALFIGLGLLFFVDYHHYAGLSAILHSIIVYGSITDIRNKDKSGWLLLLGVFVKVSYENLFSASSQTAQLIEANVAVEAHFVGALIGILIAFLLPQKRAFIFK